MADCSAARTPMQVHHQLTPDKDGQDTDQHQYRAMIGSLMYLTASRPDIMFAVCLCARFQAAPKVSHLQAVKRIFRYLKGASRLGLWGMSVSGRETDFMVVQEANMCFNFYS
ncbi:hypothetical protein L1987_01166 [Smallanthus sonchifolius]|uniref:Uncharacterized protein n=1 Tax=Smallanthus sonchifolius TaxID=185202 RepID=A0ACB9K4C5_9ASTR|nr:hypothetical protein L1987_01166 [Smallanthus sonchifolius]